MHAITVEWLVISQNESPFPPGKDIHEMKENHKRYKIMQNLSSFLF